jgi:hypothetical protein
MVEPRGFARGSTGADRSFAALSFVLTFFYFHKEQ